MSSTTEAEYIDVMIRLQAITSQMDDGPAKEFNEEVINEISSLRMALQVFSDEFDKIQQQDAQILQMGMGQEPPMH